MDIAIQLAVKNSKLQTDHKQCVRTLLRYKTLYIIDIKLIRMQWMAKVLVF